MDFTIVTPSYRQLDWLACCIASVADQKGISVEHIVQDGGTDGFADFTQKMAKIWPDRPGYRRLMVSESDHGMYDAINKGLRKGGGEICAYLNCDEQYLPDALPRAREGLESHPEAEILYGGFLVVNPQGGLVTAQRPVDLFWPHVGTSHLANFSCATFFRRNMLLRDQAWFDAGYRAVGDAAWTVARLRQKVPMAQLGGFSSIFTERPGNQGLQEAGRAEARALRRKMPMWIRWGAPLWRLRHRVGKLIAGGYSAQPVSYALFLGGNIQRRTAFPKTEVSPFWKSRLAL